MTKISIFLLALFTLVSCKYGSNDGVKKPYKELINSLENKYEDSSAPSDKFRLDRAEEIKQIADDQIDHTNSGWSVWNSARSAIVFLDYTTDM